MKYLKFLFSSYLSLSNLFLITCVNIVYIQGNSLFHIKNLLFPINSGYARMTGTMATTNLIKALENLIPNGESNTKKLKILMVGAEVAPYATVGGYSMVLAYLSKALLKRGHDVRLFIPKFGFIDNQNKYELVTVVKELKVPTGDENNPFLVCNIKSHTNDFGLITYFLENMEYYEQRANVYGYSDDATRWALLSKGALEFIRQSEEFIPDVIHTNDWHTGILPNYLKSCYKNDKVLSGIASVFTIHSLPHQGMFDHRHVSELDFDDGRSDIAPLVSDRLKKQNFMRRGILFADAINTVSKTYTKEILTSEYGEGLDKLLIEVRSKLSGILNGLDYDEFNPATDKLIERNFDLRTLELRSANKLALQREFDLVEDVKIPIIAMLGRLDYQKGTDLAINTLRHVLSDYNIQFVQVGGGDGGLANALIDLQKQFPDKVGVHPYPNFLGLPRLVFAGSDIMLLPSRFEPCGIVQLETMRYGAIPIIRKVGGLADTVSNFDSELLSGTGFVFTHFNEFALFGQIVRALELYKNKKTWQKLQRNAMSADFSWSYSAGEYEKFYTKAINLKKAPHPLSNTHQ